MAGLVHIPDVKKGTYLHMSRYKETVYFRDFSKSDTVPPKPFSSKLTRQQIDEYLAVTSGAQVNLPGTDPGIDTPEGIKTWNKWVLDANRLHIPVDPDVEREKREAERMRLEAEYEEERRRKEAEHAEECRRLERLEKQRKATILWWKIVGAIFAALAIALGFILANWKQIVEFFRDARGVQ
jgi:hypothetical protein